MQAKDRFLKRASYIFLIFIFFSSANIFANDTKLKLLNYNNNLKNSSVLFIQTDGETIEEGIIYIGSKRIKIDYTKPQNLTIVLSQKKSMYVNHELKETQFFNTNKSFVKIFFKILTGENFYENSELSINNDSIVVKNNFEIDDNFYKTQIIYENEPIKLRKIKVLENEKGFEIGFFNHNSIEIFNNNFFALINPYLN